jgi:hypothetical protein
MFLDVKDQERRAKEGERRAKVGARRRTSAHVKLTCGEIAVFSSFCSDLSSRDQISNDHKFLLDESPVYQVLSLWAHQCADVMLCM